VEKGKKREGKEGEKRSGEKRNDIGGGKKGNKSERRENEGE